MPTQDKYARWRALIASNRIAQVLDELRDVFAQSDRLSEIIHQSGRHAALGEGIRKGDIDLKDEMVVENQIRLGILDLLEDIERWEKEDTTLSQDLASVTVNIAGSVSKAVIGSTITAGGDVHVGDIYYGTEPIPHFLTAQPQNPPVFRGRAEQLKELHEKLFHGTDDQVLLLVNGQGGVGKTSLASRYFFDYHDRYHHAAWVLKDGSIRDALLSLEPGLNLQFTTETSEQRLSIILQKVANLKAPCLLIIDNANERDDLVRYVGALRQCANFHVLLTSRLDNFDGAQTYKVGALALPVAKDLFEQYYRPFNAEEAALFPDVYRAVDGNTLVLQLLAKNLKQNRRKYFLPDLLSDLRERGVLDLSRSRKVVTDYGGFNEGQIEDIVAAMFDLGDLTEQQLKLLQVFAALPPEKIPYDHLEVLVTFLDDLDGTLDELQQLGWVEESAGENSYRCSPVVQEVVSPRGGDWNEVELKVMEVLCGKLDAKNVPGQRLAVASLYVNYADHVLSHREEVHGTAIALRAYLGQYFTSIGDFGAAERQFVAQNKLLKGLISSANVPYNQVQYADSFHRVGAFRSEAGRFAQAHHCFKHAIFIYDGLLDANPGNEELSRKLSNSLLERGKIHFSRGKTKEALEDSERAIQLLEKLSNIDGDSAGLHTLSVIYLNVAGQYWRLKNTNRSRGLARKAVLILERLIGDEPDNLEFKLSLAVAYEQLANILDSAEEKEDATELRKRNLHMCQELRGREPLNVSYRYRVAHASLQLSKSYFFSANEFDLAITGTREALTLAEALTEESPDHAPFQKVLSTAYQQWGKIQFVNGNNEEAVSAYNSSLLLLENLAKSAPSIVDYKMDVACCHLDLGYILTDEELKKSAFKTAQKILTELRTDNPEFSQFQQNLDYAEKHLALLEGK